MGRGYEDYTRPSRQEQVAFMPSVIYQTGRVLLHEDFEMPVLNWAASYGSGGLVYITTVRSYSGAACLALATGSTINYVANITKKFGYPAKTKIGITLHYSMPMSGGSYFDIELRLYDAVKQLRFNVRYDMVEQAWYYRDENDAYVAIEGADQKLSRNPDTWHHAKLVVDLENQQYVSLNSDDGSFDLRGISPRNAGSATNRLVYVRLEGSTAVASSKIFYVDDVTITEED